MLQKNFTEALLSGGGGHAGERRRGWRVGLFWAQETPKHACSVQPAACSLFGAPADPAVPSLDAGKIAITSPGTRPPPPASRCRTGPPFARPPPPAAAPAPRAPSCPRFRRLASAAPPWLLTTDRAVPAVPLQCTRISYQPIARSEANVFYSSISKSLLSLDGTTLPSAYLAIRRVWTRTLPCLTKLPSWLQSGASFLPSLLRLPTSSPPHRSRHSAVSSLLPTARVVRRLPVRRGRARPRPEPVSIHHLLRRMNGRRRHDTLSFTSDVRGSRNCRGLSIPPLQF